MEKGTISMDFVAEALLVARQRGLDIAALVAGGRADAASAPLDVRLVL